MLLSIKQVEKMRKHHVAVLAEDSPSGLGLFEFTDNETATQEDRIWALKFDKRNFEAYGEHLLINYKEVEDAIKNTA